MMLLPDFEVDLVAASGAVVVAVRGEIDLASEARLTDALTAAVDEHPAVLVDLCECSFMDSVGIGAVLSASRKATARNVRFAVACTPGGAPRVLFDLVIGHTLFTTSPTREDGLAALGAGVEPSARPNARR